MGLGAFNPCPFALGGDALTGLSAEQHARIAADTVALTRSAPFAALRAWVNAGIALQTYDGMNGSGLDHGPTPTYAGAGDSTLTWARSYADDYGVSEPTQIRFAQAFVMANANAVARASILDSHQVRVETFNAQTGVAMDVTYFLVVW